LVVYLIFDYQMEEAIGAFRGEAATLNAALWTATAAALGASAARVLQLVVCRRGGWVPGGEEGPPAWYGRARPALWIGTGILSLGIPAWNLQAGFYQIGVHVRTTL